MTLKKLFFLFLLLILLFLAINQSFSRWKSTSSLLLPSFAPISKFIIPSPLPTPSPSPVLVGYCLRVPILMYHHIQPAAEASKNGQNSLTVYPDIFDQQMAYLVSSGYTTLSLEQLAQALINHQALPGKSLVLSLDDGYSDVYSYAYPILQKYHLIANLLIPTGLLENPGYLSWGQLKQMVDSGSIFAYNHTWSHKSLGSLTKDKIEQEILTAQKQLEEHLGRKTNIFAYPYGSESQPVFEVLQANGFMAAVSTIPGFYQCDSFILSLHRTRIGNSALGAYGL